ncbi:hypothetical protein N7455_012605 [Penicillium solitum]|uniref:uncharacterized protein n=1 Tax=Penicillium solitum TaxID=60172 RepID=UPI00182AE885|nr:hypothetical protein HAV15_006930 [Penicillium sp. str. \
MLGMSFKPLHTTLPDLSTRADFKSPISDTSERSTQLDTASDTAIMSDTCTETKSSPSTLTDPSAEGNHELKASISTQCDTVIENVIMPETSTATGPKSPPTDLFSPRAPGNPEASTSATWNMPTQYDSDIQTVILCENPSESDSPQISSSSQKDPSATPNASSGDPSSGRLDGSSGTKSDTSSIDSLDTNPESPPSALFDTGAQRWRKEGIQPDDQEASELKVYHPSPRAIREKLLIFEPQVTFSGISSLRTIYRSEKVIG